MADFRKWLLAFAIVALVLGTGVSASAQTTAPAFSCTAQGANPPLLRQQGVTEQVGDVVLQCTGGVPTATGAPIALSNIVITLQETGITDRILDTSTGLAEALLIIDDAYPNAPQPSTAVRAPGSGIQNLCPATGGPQCEIAATAGGATGAGGGDYDGSSGHYNVFQGVVQGANQIAFLGVPIDAPGTVNILSIRVTNIRGNASALAAGSSFSGTPVHMFIAINGTQQIVISNPNPIVGYVVNGLVPSYPSPIASFPTCLTPTSFSIDWQEGFANSFKPQTAQLAGVTPSSLTSQNIPGFAYNSESGLFDGATNSTINTQLLGTAGTADHGTILFATFLGVPPAVSLSVPLTLPLTNSTGAVTNGPDGNPSEAVLITTDPFGYSAPVTPGAGPTAAGSGNVVVVAGAGWVAYEIKNADPTSFETLTVPVGVAFASGATVDQLTGTMTATISFAPLPPPGIVGWTLPEPISSSSGAYPLPRFVNSNAPTNIASVGPCTCNLLFPFLTNAQGFDTGMSIANTTTDPFGTSPQHGTIILNYYGTQAGVALPPTLATITTPDIPTGCLFESTLSGGGTVVCPTSLTGATPAIPGFNGYMIAQAQFQYCHGYAFISDMGAHTLAEGYVAIVLDAPGLTRTGQVGENKGQ